MSTNLPPKREASLRCIVNIILFFVISSATFAQVGIGTTAPTAMLDVNGGFRIRSMAESYGSHVMTADENGHVKKVKTFLLYDAEELVAERAVTRSLTGTTTEDDINLGLEIRVIIPAYKEVKVIVAYSIPMGTAPTSSPPATYIGVKFLKNGLEEARGSRKFSMDAKDSSAADRISSMGTLTNTYIENFSASDIERVVIYKVDGYIEQHDRSGALADYEYRFNMWGAGGANYNWGKATLSYQTYIK